MGAQLICFYSVYYLWHDIKRLGTVLSIVSVERRSMVISAQVKAQHKNIKYKSFWKRQKNTCKWRVGRVGREVEMLRGTTLVRLWVSSGRCAKEVTCGWAVDSEAQVLLQHLQPVAAAQIDEAAEESPVFSPRESHLTSQLSADTATHDSWSLVGM